MYTSVCGGGVCCASLCCQCASPSMQMTSACSYSVPSIYVAFSPAGSMNGRQSCKWSVNNKLIKTHNRHQRRQTEEKNIEEKRSVGVSRGRKCQKALVTDQIKADYLNNLWYVGRAKPNRDYFQLHLSIYEWLPTHLIHNSNTNPQDCADFSAANADETCGNGCIWPVATVFLVETERAEQRVPHTKKGPQMWIKMSEHKRKKKKSMHFYLPEGHDWFCCGGLAC